MLYSGPGRASISPELLRAMLLQAFYTVRSERQLMERLKFDLLSRSFVGLGVHFRVPRFLIQPGREYPANSRRTALSTVKSATETATNIPSTFGNGLLQQSVNQMLPAHCHALLREKPTCANLHVA